MAHLGALWARNNVQAQHFAVASINAALLPLGGALTGTRFADGAAVTDWIGEQARACCFAASQFLRPICLAAPQTTVPLRAPQRRSCAQGPAARLRSSTPRC